MHLSYKKLQKETLCDIQLSSPTSWLPLSAKNQNREELKQISLCHSFLRLKLLKLLFLNHVFFWIPASIAEAAAVIPDGAKIFFAKGAAIFINGAANILNIGPKIGLNYFSDLSLRKFYVSWHIVIKCNS